MSGGRARRTFLAGALLVLPLLVTWFLLSFALEQIRHTVDPLLRVALTRWALQVPALGPDTPWMRLAVPILGFALVAGILFALGLLASHLAFRRVVATVEDTILRVPVLKAVYGTARQVADAFKGEGTGSFERVVALEYPRPGCWVLGFVTQPPSSGVRRAVGRDDLTFVFVPTSPNPTSGVLLLVPSPDLRDTGLSVEDGVKVVVSAGMIPGGTLARPANPA